MLVRLVIGVCVGELCVLQLIWNSGNLYYYWYTAFCLLEDFRFFFGWCLWREGWLKARTFRACLV